MSDDDEQRNLLEASLSLHDADMTALIAERDDALKLVANRDRLINKAYAALERIIAHEVAHDRGDAFSATEAREALGRKLVVVDREIYRNNIKPIRVGACICQCHDTPHGPCRCSCDQGTK